MTEEQAKAKWCPFVSVSPTTDRAYPMTNREERVGVRPQYEVTRCVASDCMAWRTTPMHQENVYGSPEAPAGDGWTRGSPAKTGWWWRTVGGPGDGYCGLAGEPQ